jgi:hypothetical protein
MCASSSSGAMFIERRNGDVTERQAHGSQMVEVQPGETLSSSTTGVERNFGVEAQEDRL